MSEVKFCENCGSELVQTENGYGICMNCGNSEKITVEPSSSSVVQQYQPQPVQQYRSQSGPQHPQPAQQYRAPAQQYQPQPVQQYGQQIISENQLPPQYRPLGMWAYFGYMLLFSIPIVGFIMLIVYAISNSNINRRNFARSYFCLFIILLIISIIIAVIAVVSPAFTSYLVRSSRYYY